MAKTSPKPLSFQGLILTLQNYWAEQGCVILQPFDTEVGAGTLHPRGEPEPLAALLSVPSHYEAEPT